MMLEKGGNAIDAGGRSSRLNVVGSFRIGGGGFMMVYLARRPNLMVDGRGSAGRGSAVDVS